MQFQCTLCVLWLLNQQNTEEIVYRRWVNGIVFHWAMLTRARYNATWVQRISSSKFDTDDDHMFVIRWGGFWELSAPRICWKLLITNYIFDLKADVELINLIAEIRSSSGSGLLRDKIRLNDWLCTCVECRKSWRWVMVVVFFLTNLAGRIIRKNEIPLGRHFRNDFRKVWTVICWNKG